MEEMLFSEVLWNANGNFLVYDLGVPPWCLHTMSRLHERIGLFFDFEADLTEMLRAGQGRLHGPPGDCVWETWVRRVVRL